MENPSAESRRVLEGTSARRTLLWVLSCALLVAGSTFLPYLYAYLAAPSGTQFGGILINPQDGYSYLAKMRQGARGEWTFRLSYTSEDHEGGFVYTFYLALGRLSSALGLPPILAYHLARLLTGVFLLVAVFYTALAIFGQEDRAWAGFAIAALSSGVGWLTIFFGHMASDMWIPESVTYYAIYTNPHFPLGMGFLILAFLALLKAIERRQARYALAAGLITLAQTLVQPFLIITTYCVSLVWLAWRWVGLKRVAREEAVYLGLLVGLSAPGVVDNYVALYLNPVLREWLSQNVTLSPPPYDFVLGYGLLAFLAALGAAYLWRSEKALLVSAECRQLLLVWTVVTLVLLYFPFSLQRRLVTGLHIVFSLLAVVGFYGYLAPSQQAAMAGQPCGGTTEGGEAETARGPYGANSAKPGSRKGLLAVLLVAMVPSNLFLLIFAAPSFGNYPYPLYLKDGEVSALRWLGENTGAMDTVLSSEKTGNVIPALAGNRVFYGHPFETVKAEEKRDLLDRFFAGKMSEEEERSFLSKYGIGLIYYGRSERELGSYDPATKPYLERVFGNGDVAIYQVKASRGQLLRGAAIETEGGKRLV